MNPSALNLRGRWAARLGLGRISPATRVALGLVALMIMLLLLVDMLVRGFMPDPTEQARRERKLAVQVLAGQLAGSLQSQGGGPPEQLLQQALQAHPDMRSVAVLTYDGRLSASSEHRRLWTLAPEAPSTLENVRVQLLVDERPWGELQVGFAPVLPSGWRAWLGLPLVQGLLALVALGFLVFYLYLRRAMVYLDPSRVIPERVRSALDTLTEGVLVLDARETVLLANRAFSELAAEGAELTGRPIESLGWLLDAARTGGQEAPWRLAQRSGEAQIGVRLELATPAGTRYAIMNCSPIGDGGGPARGCLISLSDVTELQERTEKLREALVELEASQQEIRRKNEELLLLATRDPLTGCLNRRAFVSESASLLAEAERQQQPVSCLMCDIDHFKRVNDTYGHAGGDVVLQAAAKTLGSGLRAGDLLARFGGEEFCLLLNNASLEQAREIAERLRAEVEAHVGQALREVEGVRVTMSFGIEVYGRRHKNLDAVIDLADQALYHSKKSGRNRVTAYEDLPAT